ncbi:hypothetical protein SAMD00019534_064610 [Acytostelium subglobosum LB1]|uniref:hypothetical protein n=1 Tax=Acytostelium subglobosum LB1 TaxID=1410327 RepID=UPI000644A8A1|nr:hypothetical protein SAMD00019534_064610 [Acytostelium subglobosum LB1]GAM23286.1 hypothetical protein SAMD00019534_064610 [Acytostelium subglobosum LB1]|eukprot:XP_012753735.1 hypothetical protein SAMD00019534_064610 [Acytostelium subglobosum LB1]
MAEQLNELFNDAVAHFKQATIGQCNTKQPSFFDFVGKAKWGSWSSLGDLSKEQSMKNYIARLDTLAPKWRESKQQQRQQQENTSTTSTSESSTTTTSTTSTKPQDSVFEDDSEEDAKPSKGMGPVMSRFSMIGQEDIDNATSSDPKHDLIYWVSCDDEEKVKEILGQQGLAINEREENGKTALMWSCDRGHVEITKLLLSVSGVDVNCQDNIGMTALHYASLCAFGDIVTLLLQHQGIDCTLLENDGKTALQLVDPSETDVIALFNNR